MFILAIPFIWDQKKFAGGGGGCKVTLVSVFVQRAGDQSGQRACYNDNYAIWVKAFR